MKLRKYIKSRKFLMNSFNSLYTKFLITFMYTVVVRNKNVFIKKNFFCMCVKILLSLLLLTLLDKRAR